MRAGSFRFLVWCFWVESVSSWMVSPLQESRNADRKGLDGFQLHMSDPFSSYLNNMDGIPDNGNNEDDLEEEPTGQANTRFSKFAPDTNLPTEDFRAQLKENMKADLERRRREDPNRGNQPAKSYLDSL